MRFLGRLITPIILAAMVLLALREGQYVMAFSATIMLGLTGYGLMDSPDKRACSRPDIIERGPGYATFNNETYPAWLKTADGKLYTYYGLDATLAARHQLDSLLEDGLLYHGIKYTPSLNK